MFGLEPAPSYRLTRSPLSQAFGQVRFPVRAKLPSLEGVAPIQERLDRLFPYMVQQQTQQVSLLLGPAGSSTTGGQTSQAWHFSDDNGWSLVLSAETATLAVGPEYGKFSEFSDRLRAILIALEEGAGVTRVDRLGIRYVNIAEIAPGDPEAWRKWFRPELTGWSATSTVADGTRLLTSITQTQLSAPPTGRLSAPPVNIQAMVRHGFIPANTFIPGVLPHQPQHSAFLLDIDLFIEAPQPFNANDLSSQITQLHDEIDRFFYWSIAPEGADYFGVEVLS